MDSRILVVFASDGMRHTFVFYLGITLWREVGPCIYEYRCPDRPPLWIAVVQESPTAALAFAARHQLNVHNYTRHGIMGPGGLHTVQQWLGNTCTVRQRYGDEVTYFIQRELQGTAATFLSPSTAAPTTAPPFHSPSESQSFFGSTESTAEPLIDTLERVLARSLESYAAEQSGRQSPCPGWVEPLRRFPSEPAVPGVHPQCLVCLEKRASVALVDCGHQVICDECACICWSSGGGLRRECLVCRKPIRGAPVHLFPSEPITKV